MPGDKAESFYLNESGRAYHAHKRGVPLSAIEWISRSRARKFQSYVSTADVVLELGVGAGWNLRSLSCRRKIGVDISTFLAGELGEAGIEFFEDLSSVPEGSVDIAICHHALEHLADPYAALGGLKKRLSKGGKMLLAVPYEKERRYRRFNPEEPNHHLYSWSVQTLGNLVDAAGFKVEEARLQRYGYDRRAARVAHRFHLGEGGFCALRYLMILVRPLQEVFIAAGAG